MFSRHTFEVILYKTYAELRADASRYYLSFLWWLFEPMLYMTAFYIVFGLLFQRGGEGFVGFLLTGLVAWKWFDAMVRQGANSIRSAGGIMQQVYLPKYIFPGVLVLTNTVKFLFVLMILLIFLVFYGVTPGATWLALPVVMAVQLLFAAGFAGTLAAVMPFVPDLRLLINNGLTLMLFLSGVFYDVTEVPAELRGYFYLNPMAVILTEYRAVLLKGQWPDWFALGVTASVAALFLWLAYYLFKRYDKVYPKVVSS